MNMPPVALVALSRLPAARPRLADAARVAGVALLTCLAALPWGLPADQRFVLPLLPLAAIHACNLRRAGSCPEWVAFACGVALDVVTQGPLGFWAFLYLLGHALGVGSAPVARRLPARLGLPVAALVIAACVGWLLSGLYYWEATDWRPWARAVLWALAPATVIGLLFGGTASAHARRDNARLERGA